MLTPLAKLVAAQGEVAEQFYRGYIGGWGGNSGKWPALGKYRDLN